MPYAPSWSNRNRRRVSQFGVLSLCVVNFGPPVVLLFCSHIVSALRQEIVEDLFSCIVSCFTLSARITQTKYVSLPTNYNLWCLYHHCSLPNFDLEL
jgi:hypothetical protein